MPHAMVPVTAVDVAAVAQTLAEAFVDDPVKMFLVGAEREVPVAASLPFFRTFTRIQMGHGHVYRTAGTEAAAIWAPPDEWKIPVRTVVRHTPTFLRLYGLRLVQNLAVLDRLERAHPHAPHYYLEFIGTRPSDQGRGFGTALIAPMIERCDAEGVGAYLESSKQSNVAYNARFGFEVAQELQHPRGGPRQWLMWQDPR